MWVSCFTACDYYIIIGILPRHPQGVITVCLQQLILGAVFYSDLYVCIILYTHTAKRRCRRFLRCKAIVIKQDVNKGDTPGLRSTLIYIPTSRGPHTRKLKQIKNKFWFILSAWDKFLAPTKTYPKPRDVLYTFRGRV